ncbi:MAG: alpha/beta fold hydrolase [Sandaracinaceae bacterium]
MGIQQVEFAHNGLTLRGEQRGEGPVVLLLHGGGQTRHAWRNTLSTVAEAGFRAIAMDARGHGQSDWAAGPDYLLTDFVSDLLAIGGQLAQPVIVVGASLGGLTGLLALEEGLDGSALVLVDVVPNLEPEGVARIVGFMRAFPDGFESVEACADAVAEYLPHRPRPPDSRGLEKNLRRSADGRWHWHWDPRFVEQINTPDSGFGRAEAAARALLVPTLLVRGAKSDIVSEEGAARFRRLVPHADDVDVSGARHMLAGDENDAFTDAVVAFLAGVVRA